MRSPTGLLPPIAGPRPGDGRSTPPEETDDEWESLPHLDSTMLAHPGGVPAPVMPPVAVRKFSPNLRDHGDLPTVRPQDLPVRGASTPPVEEPVDHTIAGELPAIGGPQFEDLPTPVKGTVAPRALGFERDSDSEFAEDTNKGDGPRGMAQPTAIGDPSVELSDDDFEDLL